MDFFGRFLIKGSSVSEPGITFDEDRKTGWYHFAADTFGFAANGAVKALLRATNTLFVNRVTEINTLTNFNTAGNVTLTAAAILGGIITRDPNGAGRSDEVDTAANIIATCGLDNDFQVITCKLINTAAGAFAITFGAAAPAGVTYANAGQTLAQNESAELVIMRTSATTVTVYIIGA